MLALADKLLRRPFLSATVLAAALGLFWLHALQVPFWGDDFNLLDIARQARLTGESWLSVLWPSHKSIFWRPLSEGIYWRIVEGPLDANPTAAHAVNILFLVAASLAVGWLCGTCAPMLSPGTNPHKAFLIGGFLYGIHGAHFLPAVWATAVHSSMVVLFAALALRCWLAGLRDSAAGLEMRLSPVPVFLLLALFSKENGILVLPLGALLTALLWHRYRPDARAWIVAAISLGTALAWLRIRQGMIVPPSGAYEMGIGLNSGRNLLSMALFLFNVPRESLRFMLEQGSVLAGLWALGCAGLQAVAFWLMLRTGRNLSSPIGASATLAFFLVAGAPYLLFSWNSYAYYIGLGLIVWPLLAAAGRDRPRMGWALSAALLSSAIAIGGNYALDYPALVARAVYADRQLALVRAHFPGIADQVREDGLQVIVENGHKFQAIGEAGLAYTLDLPRGKFQVVEAGKAIADHRPRLIVPAKGDIRFE